MLFILAKSFENVSVPVRFSPWDSFVDRLHISHLLSPHPFKVETAVEKGIWMHILTTHIVSRTN